MRNNDVINVQLLNKSERLNINSFIFSACFICDLCATDFMWLHLIDIHLWYVCIDIVHKLNDTSHPELIGTHFKVLFLVLYTIFFAEYSKRVYQGVRVKHTVKDLLAEKRSRETSGPCYMVIPPLNLTWSIPSTEIYPALSFTMLPFTPFTLPLCSSFKYANSQFKIVGVFCAPPLYLLIGLSFLF